MACLALWLWLPTRGQRGQAACGHSPSRAVHQGDTPGASAILNVNLLALRQRLSRPLRGVSLDVLGDRRQFDLLSVSTLLLHSSVESRGASAQHPSPLSD
jgi:hypothetical protein